MALEKQSVDISFAKGLDLKTDPFRIAVGNFLELENSIFTKAGLLQKRNGFKQLNSLTPNYTHLTTFSGNLTAIGDQLSALSQSSMNWVIKGNIQPVQVDTLALVRSNTNQSYADCAVATNGLVCTAYEDDLPDGMGGTMPSYKYVIADSQSGQNIIPPTLIPSSGAVTNTPKVFYLGTYFVIVYDDLVSATNHLKFIAISVVNPTISTAPADISVQYTPSTTGNFDGFVANNKLYIAWNGSDGGGAIRIISLNQHLGLSSPKVFSGHVATLMSVTADATGNAPIVYAYFYDSVSQDGFVLAVDQNLNTVLAPTQTNSSESILNITSAALNGTLTIFYEIENYYSYDMAIQTDYIVFNTVSMGGAVGTPKILARGVGLASKAFIEDSRIYILSIYVSPFQPTYFLLNIEGQVIAKLAYQNGGSYYITGLPNANISSTIVRFPYLIKDLIQPINKNQDAPSNAAVYSQTGVNLASINLFNNDIQDVEIGQNLHISGGFLWDYDGYNINENGFFLWPDSVEATWSATGGSVHAQPDGSTNTDAYFYQVTYEWSDNQGNIYRSAPSIPVSVTTTGSGTVGSIELNIPTLRMTYKINNPVKIVIYRWSVAQEVYYQVTSVQSPLLNDPTTDSVTYTDTLADASIVGNAIIYTTGGVIENISPPPFSAMTLYKSRLVGIDSEDKNVLWYSKQVIEDVPVEMSDLFTIYVAPTASVIKTGTGPNKALGVLDDKLIVFKQDAIYYLVGNGPDNTGANNDFSEPVFITSSVGSSNPDSLVVIPQGLMFQSNKGIWLLGRDLGTSYIGAPVETFNDFKVKSAISVPATNQVRFTLDNGITLMYDYYYNQWGTFNGIPGISSTIYQESHAFLNANGLIFQEEANFFLDGSQPVIMRFKTGWLNLAGLQGFQRAYFFYLLGTYISPHKLSIEIAYDYALSPSQSIVIRPDNFSPTWGSDPIWGDSEFWGGQGNREQWKIFFNQQKCQSFQITMTEMYDPNIVGGKAGAGLTLSGLDVLVGLKSSYPRLRASRQTG